MSFPWKARPQLIGALLAIWGRQPGLWLGYVVDVLSAIGLGLALVLGGRERTHAPAFAPLNANGGPVLWGCILIALGFVTLVTPFLVDTLIFWVLLALAVVYGLFCWWFAAAALADHASFVGAIFALRAVVTHVTRAASYRLEGV